MINRTESWRTSSGTCFEDKKSAYNEEIKYLLQSLPKGHDRKPLSSVLKVLTKEVERWLLLAEEFKMSVQRSPVDEKLLAVKEFKRIVDNVTAWYQSATTLLEQISRETDMEVKRSIDGQGG